jgi:SAM-dependent methyltransferase
MLSFTLLSFLSTPPAVWLAFGFGLLSVFFWQKWKYLVAFAAVVGITAIPQPDSDWSPYHRIDLSPIRTADSSEISGYSLHYNHMWYQTMVDLSPDFMRQHPNEVTNRLVRDYYELPYQFVTSPRSVLVVGAGTGNDVAAALRHGAEHVDAVEIDPVILELGRKYHPERPYDSPKVTEYIDDARAYFQKCRGKYDLIVFGFLDSSTLLASSSSLRLDNYVYTRESFESARKLLTPDGTLVLAFAVTRGYVADRLFVTLTDSFGVEPRAFTTVTQVYGMVYVEGAARNKITPNSEPEVTAELVKSSRGAAVATDDWPFLYLEAKRIPGTLYLSMFVFVASLWFWQNDKIQSQLPTKSGQFFLLGVGFLLLETRAVTQLSLLFGSTWLVVAVVVSSFLFMALAANAFAMRFTPNLNLCYGALLFLVMLSLVVPYSLVVGFPTAAKVLVAAFGAALPVFFSGMIFSSTLKRSSMPSAALGVNLLGAVVGGVLENGVMFGGVALVGGLAVLAYAGAWFISKRKVPHPVLTLK